MAVGSGGELDHEPGAALTVEPIGDPDPAAVHAHVLVDQGQPEDAEGFVEFKAYYTLGGEDVTHHEVASFRKEDGAWYFVEGEPVRQQPFVREEPKVGRNDPCPCGSGKKYKKCCLH